MLPKTELASLTGNVFSVLSHTVWTFTLVMQKQLFKQASASNINSAKVVNARPRISGLVSG